jgi:uncharacterized protein (TIGR00290 family)
MHGVRVELLKKQAASVNLPLTIMEVPDMPTMEVYEKTMGDIVSNLKKKGITHSIFGDIFLEDLRKYREDKLAELDLQAVFPLWNKPTKGLLEEFLNLGFKPIITCVNEKYLDKSYAGKVIDQDFIAKLPSNVDPCGENGEFHTFVFDGPLFNEPIRFTIGEVVYRKYSAASGNDDNSCNNNDPFDTGFFYCDLIPT